MSSCSIQSCPVRYDALGERIRRKATLKRGGNVKKKLAGIVFLSVTSAAAWAQTAAPNSANASPYQPPVLQEALDDAAITGTGTTNFADLLATLPDASSIPPTREVGHDA